VSEHGIKWDGDKPRFDLVPPFIEEEVAKVLTVGAAKYAPDNWKKVPDGKRRYIAAILRHISAYRQGETYDQDDGLHHMAHAICCAMFLGEADLTGSPLPPALSSDEQKKSATPMLNEEKE
jgi:hypothetical protein